MFSLLKLQAPDVALKLFGSKPNAICKCAIGAIRCERFHLRISITDAYRRTTFDWGRTPTNADVIVRFGMAFVDFLGKSYSS